MRTKLLIAVPVILLVGAGALWQVSKSRTFQFFGLIVPRVNTSEKVVALTFDDGPTPGATSEILKVLGEMNVSGEINFRPPYGKKLLALPYYLSKTGRKTITWDVEPDSNPKIARDATQIIEYARSQVRPGSIILLHVMYSSRQESLKAVGCIIGSLQREGYRFVTISELLRAAD